MPLNREEQLVFLMNKKRPIVGLIHKETKQIVLAPCISPKVKLILNTYGEVVSGFFLDNKLRSKSEINQAELDKMNKLFNQGYMPRLCEISAWNERSSHELLFRNKCNSTEVYDWGGFSFQINDSNHIKFEFSSGSFNSPKGKRIQGAQLSPELSEEVRRQIFELVSEDNCQEEEKENSLPPSPNQERAGQSLQDETPSMKRPRTEEGAQNINSKLAKQGVFGRSLSYENLLANPLHNTDKVISSKK